jgi:hypothetical protein
MRAFDLFLGNFFELTPTSVGAGVNYQYCQNGSLGMKVIFLIPFYLQAVHVHLANGVNLRKA